MNQFSIYFQLGLEHISDFQGLDHIVFLLTLCAVYSVSDWKKVAWLVTAFTLGHSLSLCLAALNIVSVNSQLIEFLIPVTILFTALANIFYHSGNEGTKALRYFIVLLFGIIHGLGFSNFFSSLIGSSENILFPLFSFNLGLELGQLLIVCSFFVLYLFLIRIDYFTQARWKYFLSITGAIIAVVLIFNRVNLL